MGLLPRIVRSRRHVTTQKVARTAVGTVAQPVLRVLRPRPGLGQDSDDSDEDSLLDGLDSPTSSASTVSVSFRPALHMKHENRRNISNTLPPVLVMWHPLPPGP